MALIASQITEEANNVYVALVLIMAALFLVVSIYSGRKPASGYLRAFIRATPHLIAVWLPLILSVCLLYIFVALGLMGDYDSTFDSIDDLSVTRPRWGIVALFLAGLAELINLGRIMEIYLIGKDGAPSFAQIKSFAFLVMALAALYFVTVDAKATLAMAPLISWIFINDRQGWGKAIDVTLYLFGGLSAILLLYLLGVLILDDGLLALWYLLLAISIRLLSFPNVAFISAIVAAGLSLVINIPKPKRKTDQPL